MTEKGIPNLDHILGSGATERCEELDLWPTPDQRQQLELLLGWPYGTLQAIAVRPPYDELDGSSHALVTMISDMEPADRTALIELLKVTQIRRRQESAPARSAVHHRQGALALEVLRLLGSMGRVASSADNALIESFWSTMQRELLNRQHGSSRVQLASAIFEWIEGWYNPRRRRTSLGNLSPHEFEVLRTVTLTAA